VNASNEVGALVQVNLHSDDLGVEVGLAQKGAVSEPLPLAGGQSDLIEL
jgi:hypothetical protein